MTQPRPMSTPIFDELLREFASRMEEQQRTAQQPEQPDQAPQPQASQSVHRHRAE
ncbi:hypothetical protein [Kibdelosporangium aridum]|uniref:Uncharacterized protein n=1 Tax=Kibdelosporangium aridum TaxID=2030 RepID=A0A1W2FA62_KIBAR|nr:hypothetical protein [Kibdelosporangium aridum]SMD18820.1 hypothetical protein SAMN05661093_05911 [Kibdelosporangium aridum]